MSVVLDGWVIGAGSTWVSSRSQFAKVPLVVFGLQLNIDQLQIPGWGWQSNETKPSLDVLFPMWPICPRCIERPIDALFDVWLPHPLMHFDWIKIE